MNTKTGIISKWNDEKGYGFITPTLGDKQLFFHIKNYSTSHKRPIQSLKVKYIGQINPLGKGCAVDVVPTKGHKNVARKLQQMLFALAFLGFCSLVFYYLFKTNLFCSELIIFYSFLSIVTFMVYAKDKKAAQNNQWRTPEYRLHFLSMLGGWVGAKIAQTLLRHKSIKKSFLVKYWITVAINCGVLFWLATIEGQLWMFQGRKLLKLIVTQVF